MAECNRKIYRGGGLGKIKSDGGCFQKYIGGGGYCYKKYGGGYLVFKIYHAVIESRDVGIGCATQSVRGPTSLCRSFGWVGLLSG
jgi:hypothetical protein